MKKIYLIILSLLIVSCGQRDGTHIEYHENGKVSIKGNFKNGKKDGQWIYYYENGEKEEELNYKEDVLEGKSFQYYEDGKIKLETNLIDGQIVSMIEYNKDGSIFKEINIDGETIKETVH